MTPISLPADLSQFVSDQLARGRYASADEVVRKALELLRQREQEQDALRAMIEVGWQQADRGEGCDLDNSDDRRQLLARVTALRVPQS